MSLRAFVAEPDGSRLRMQECIVPWPATDEAAASVGKELGGLLKNA
jgi:hypothetical protein